MLLGRRGPDMRTTLAAVLATTACLALSARAGAAGAAGDAAPEIGPIDPEALPPDPAVREAWVAAAAQAPYAATWDVEWKHPVPKEDVAKRLAASFETLRRAADDTRNPELLLALGVAARFAHNVDVPEAGDAGIAALKRAVALEGSDPRREWLLGGSLCHGNFAEEGWPHIEKALASLQGKPPPAAFWHDYFFCATAGAMPAHQLHALKALAALGAGTRLETAATEVARRFYLEPSLAAEYPVEKALDLEKEKEGTRVRIANRICGFSFLIEGELPLKMRPVKDGMCFVESYVGPFPGKTQVHPGIFVIARAQREGKPDPLLDALAPPDQRAAAKGFACPVPGCRMFEVRNPEHYPADGGGVAIVVAFERDAPEFPGFTFERPFVPRGEPGEVNYFVVKPRLGRFPGRISYYVVLDTAVSVLPAAKAEFARFLQDLVVE
jgi:hypothetical protein